VGDDHFRTLYDGLRGLNDCSLLSAFEVAEACLRYATLSTADGHVFDLAPVRALDVKSKIESHVGGHISSGFDPKDLEAIAEAIARSENKPLAAWYTADRISMAISQSFAAGMDDSTIRIRLPWPSPPHRGKEKVRRDIGGHSG
jgi:hypothetical protein